MSPDLPAPTEAQHPPWLYEHTPDAQKHPFAHATLPSGPLSGQTLDEPLLPDAPEPLLPDASEPPLLDDPPLGLPPPELPELELQPPPNPVPT